MLPPLTDVMFQGSVSSLKGQVILRNTRTTYDEAKLFVVAGVHGLAFLNATTVVGLALHVESNSPQLKDDVPLSLHMYKGILKCCPDMHITSLLFSISYILNDSVSFEPCGLLQPVLCSSIIILIIIPSDYIRSELPSNRWGKDEWFFTTINTMLSWHTEKNNHCHMLPLLFFTGSLWTPATCSHILIFTKLPW